MSSHLYVLTVSIRPANRDCVFIYTHNCAFKHWIPNTQQIFVYLRTNNQIGRVGSYGYKIESLFKRSMGELVFERKAWDPRGVWTHRNELEDRGVVQSGGWRPQECLMASGDKHRQKLMGMDFPLRYILSKLLARTWQVCHLCTELFPPTTLSASKQSPLLEQGWSDAETKGQREKKKPDSFSG